MNDSPTIAFRVDASTLIGSGHVMRCLTLADALAESGACCYFVMRAQSGSLERMVKGRGHRVLMLPKPQETISEVSGNSASHASWLGTDWHSDASETVSALAGIEPDWLVVDHYALDQKWEALVSSYAARVMVIDDLADRHHDCDLLLDQNLGRLERDYDGLVPNRANRLIGPGYALLRLEFSDARDESLARREHAKVETVLVSMGGVDKENITGDVLTILESIAEVRACRVTVVLGASCPNIDAVSRQAEFSPLPVELHVNAGNMAELMAGADLAIGAAGGSAWERCCLGLPALLVVMADNQRDGAQALHETGAALCIGGIEDIQESLPAAIGSVFEPSVLREMSQRAAAICDGSGVDRIINALTGDGK